MICFQLLVTVLAVLCLYGASLVDEEYMRCLDVLGASSVDSVATIKSKYRQLALIHHPDRLNAQLKVPGEDFRTMEDINEAYDCVLRSYIRGEVAEPHDIQIPHALSERATYLIEQIHSMWGSIPDVQRNDFIVEVKDYFGSEDLPGDVVFLVGKYWSNNATETLQILARTIVFVLLVNCVLCTIGVVTIGYYFLKFLLWVVRGVFVVCRYLFVAPKVKTD